MPKMTACHFVITADVLIYCHRFSSVTTNSTMYYISYYILVLLKKYVVMIDRMSVYTKY